jgi:hypothetical protein
VTVFSRLPKQQDELDVILHDRVWFVWLAQKRGAITFDFRHSVRDLVPDDRGEGVKAGFLALNLNLRVQGFNQMPTELAA